MKAGEVIRKRREEILRIAAKHGARTVRVFGSVIREEADEQSDIDFLLELEPGRSLLDLGGLQYELEHLLGCRVDVVTEGGSKRAFTTVFCARPFPYGGPEERVADIPEAIRG